MGLLQKYDSALVANRAAVHNALTSMGEVCWVEALVPLQNHCRCHQRNRVAGIDMAARQ